VIKEFSKFLPTEIEYQQEAEEEAEENKIEYYDEEISDPDDHDSEEDPEESKVYEVKPGAESTAAESVQESTAQIVSTAERVDCTEDDSESDENGEKKPIKSAFMMEGDDDPEEDPEKVK